MFDMERFTKGKLNGANLIIYCCNCKKIQDSASGEWLEITPPEEVALSHSYCIPCVKELYPEIFDNILVKEIIAQKKRLEKIKRSNRVTQSIAEYILSKLISEKCTKRKSNKEDMSE